MDLLSRRKTFHAFTHKFSGLRPQLISQAQARHGRKTVAVNALWDTGAMKTCISTELAKNLALVATGKKDIRTPSGTKTVNTYLIDIILPNEIKVPDIEVCDSAIGAQGLGLLLGMDIISQGDFSVSNYQGNTAFTFRIPSQGIIDYTATES